MDNTVMATKGVTHLPRLIIAAVCLWSFMILPAQAARYLNYDYEYHPGSKAIDNGMPAMESLSNKQKGEPPLRDLLGLKYPAVRMEISFAFGFGSEKWKLMAFAQEGPNGQPPNPKAEVSPAQALEEEIMPLPDEMSDRALYLNRGEGIAERYKEMELLINTLEKSEDVIACGSAAKALTKIGTPAIKALVAAARNKDNDWFARSLAVQALGEIKDARAAGPLAEMLKDEDTNVCRSAVEALIGLGSLATDALLKVLQDEDGFVRSLAARALGGIKDPKAVEPLIAALKNSDWRVRRAASEALGMIKDNRAVGALTIALGDENIDVRRNAVTALGNIGGERAAEPLIKILWNKSEDSSIRHAAAKILSRIKTPDVARALAEVLKNDRDIGVRRAAAWALGEIRIGEPAAVGALISALEDEEHSVCASAAEALGRIKAAIAIEPLVKALIKASQGIRRSDIVHSAKWALLRMGQPAIGPLIEALPQDKGGVALGALCAIAREKIEDVLNKAALEHGNPKVRAAAEKALQKIR